MDDRGAALGATGGVNPVKTGLGGSEIKPDRERASVGLCFVGLWALIGGGKGGGRGSGSSGEGGSDAGEGAEVRGT